MGPQRIEQVCKRSLGGEIGYQLCVCTFDSSLGSSSRRCSQIDEALKENEDELDIETDFDDSEMTTCLRPGGGGRGVDLAELKEVRRLHTFEKLD